MKQLLVSGIKMTSLDIAELTGKRHDHVMRDIRNELKELGNEIGAPIFGETSYKDKSNRDSPCYEFGKDGAMQLALKYDAKTRYRVIKHIEELESGSRGLPTTYKEALLQLVERVEENESLQREKLLLEEKIETDRRYTTFGKVVSSSDTAIGVGEFAKMVYEKHGIKLGRNTMFVWLRDQGFLMLGGREKNNPKQRYIEQGLFEVKPTIVSRSHGDVEQLTTLITGKGQVLLTEKLVNHFKGSQISV